MSSCSSDGRNKVFNSREKAQKAQKRRENRIGAKERKERKDTERGVNLCGSPFYDRSAPLLPLPFYLSPFTLLPLRLAVFARHFLLPFCAFCAFLRLFLSYS
jgi:hypothetical protein